MYMLPSFLDMAIKNLKQKWMSKIHKEVAENLCLCNPSIVTMDDLMHNINIVNKIPKNKIKILTFDRARELGIRF